MKTHLNATSLSIIALGMITGGLVACANDAQGTQDSETDQQTASITARGINVAGCGANAVFSVNNSSNNFQKNIDFIAIDQSDFSNLTSQLSSFNEQNQQTLVANSADTLNTSMQELINEFTSNTNAFQESQSKLHENQSSSANTTINQTVSHSDNTEVTTDSFSESESSRSGSARNRALSTSSSSNFSLVAAEQENNNSFSNSTSNVTSSSGFVGVTPTIALGVATTTAPFFNSASFSNNSGFNESSLRSVQKNANNAFNLVASNNETSFANSTKQSQRQHTSSAQRNEFTRSLRSSTSDSASRDFDSEQAQESSLRASQKNLSKSESFSKNETHVAFKSLSELEAKSFQLNVNMQASNNKSHTLRVFTGSNSQINAMRNFNISFPSCVGIDP